MKKIIDVLEFVSVPDRQFVFLSDKTVKEPNGEEYCFITSVSRIKDARVFTLEEVIYRRTVNVNNIELIDEITIESFDPDMINVILSSYRFSEDYKYCAGEEMISEINDIEDNLGALVNATIDWFNKTYISK
jgi:hypothetical protein